KWRSRSSCAGHRCSRFLKRRARRTRRRTRAPAASRSAPRSLRASTPRFRVGRRRARCRHFRVRAAARPPQGSRHFRLIGVHALIGVGTPPHLPWLRWLDILEQAMRATFKAVAGLCLLLLVSACLVETEATLADPDPGAMDQRLVGTWYSAKG